MQSLSWVHDVAHDVAPHMYSPHDALVTVWQTPAPSHVRAGVNVDTVHDWPTQVVPASQRRQAPAPSHVPSNPQLSVDSCMHSLPGSVPAVTGRHWPSAAPVIAAAHALQLPVHAVSQHTPSTQLPLAHSEPAAHTVPLVFGATHVVPTQALPGAQSATDVHDVLHVVVPHAYAPHDVVLAVWHVPAPSQVLAGVCVVPLHDAVPQLVPAAHRRHAPSPSHMPSRPQLSDASGLQSLSGSLPPGIVRQMPLGWLVLLFAHATQGPTHADSQQKPSTQNRLAHSPDPAHAAPLAFAGTHEPDEQRLPLEQSPLTVHVVLHVVASQA